MKEHRQQGFEMLENEIDLQRQRRKKFTTDINSLRTCFFGWKSGLVFSYIGVYPPGFENVHPFRGQGGSDVSSLPPSSLLPPHPTNNFFST